MSDFEGSFLEEQLERMRRMTERMSQVHSRVIENSARIVRERDRLQTTHDNVVRDVRRHQTHNYPEVSKRKRKR